MCDWNLSCVTKLSLNESTLNYFIYDCINFTKGFNLGLINFTSFCVGLIKNAQLR